MMTERTTMRTMCGVQRNDRISVQNVMVMLVLSEEMDQLAMTKGYVGMDMYSGEKVVLFSEGHLSLKL